MGEKVAEEHLKGKTVVFLHPDLGIGGAERLVVDAGLALRARGLRVHYLTSHHDPTHSFAETADGTLPVTVVGSWLPRSILGGCRAVCAYVRLLLAAFSLCVGLVDVPRPDLVFCDQISAVVPVFRLLRPSWPVLFYCHFPDLLLSSRESVLKSLYRWPIDKLEEWSTGLANAVLVNSKYTESVFRSTFRSLASVPVEVVHPSLNTAAYPSSPPSLPRDFLPTKAKHIFLSINRYERKKDIGLAIKALYILRDMVQAEVWEGTHLVVAGGYDSQLPENVQVFGELTAVADQLAVSGHVTFLRSPSDSAKHALLHACLALLYTPQKEHFGIVPIEAMFCRRPVVAVRSGGPLETVEDGQTGILTEGTPKSFADAMARLLGDSEAAKKMGEKGRRNVDKRFSFEAFADKLLAICDLLIH